MMKKIKNGLSVNQKAMETKESKESLNIFGSECLFNKQSIDNLKKQNENVFEGFFILYPESSSNHQQDHEDKWISNEEIVKITSQFDHDQNNVVKLVKKMIHPFYGEVTLTSESFKRLSSEFVGKIELIVRKKDDLRRICHVRHEGKSGDDKPEKFLESEWKIHDDISHRGWNLVKKGKILEFSHLGRDEEWMNHQLKDAFIEDVEPIVENCIDSNNALISTLGAYNLQNILSYLHVNDLNNCYKSFKIFRDLISSRDFVTRLIESQCITLPKMYYQKTQRNLKHCTLLELLKLFHQRRDKYSMGMKLGGSYVIWLNERYWLTNKSRESEYGSTIKLDSVWWFDFGASFYLRNGHYKLSLRYKTGQTASGLDRNFTVKASSQNSGVETSSIKNTCSFTASREWTSVPLGEVIVTSGKPGSLSIKIYDHNNTYKAGLEIDCFQFEKI